MTFDRTEQLVRDAFADEAARAVDSREVLANLRGSRPPRRYGVMVAAAVVVVVAAVAAFVVPTVFRESTPPATDRGQGSAPAVPSQAVLVVGVDDGGQTDSVVLARLAADGSATLTSLPRDAWVRVPTNGGMAKLNQVYQRFGVDALLATVGDLTGLLPDHYAVVDMAAAGELATAVGGVPVCLKAATEDRLAGASFPAGEQTLRGDAAIAFLRQRHGLPNGDLDRIARHQAFLRSLATELRAVDLPEALDALKDHVTTDPDLDLLGLATAMAEAKELRVGTIPTLDLDHPSPEAGSVIIVDPGAVREFVARQQDTPPVASDVPCVD
jgi:LCP family protein required for cell wall assembly